jgi:L-alanine-DL-glutamate epimerase-like enolase superfamily enzyme
MFILKLSIIKISAYGNWRFRLFLKGYKVNQFTEIKIAKIDAFVHRVPVEIPVATSFGTLTSRSAVFVRIEDADGVFGWGEVFANWPVAGAEHRARLLMEDIADLVIGTSVPHPSDLFYQLEQKTHIRALQCGEWGPFRHVIAGLDIAIHDLFARRAGIPLRNLLNDKAADSIPAYASGIHIDGAGDIIEQSRKDGFCDFKVKVGFDPNSDISQMQDIAAIVGDDERLFADANQAWDTDTAISFIKGVEDCNLGWLEEPIPADAPLESWLHVASETAVPLAGGENIAGFDSFEHAIQSGVFKFLQPDIAKWGGFSGCFSVAKSALENGLIYCPHFLGGGIGLIASAHLLAAVGGNGLLEVDVNPNPLRDAFDLAKNNIKFGRWKMDDVVGLGITEVPAELLEYQTLCLHKEI